jgi:hypothetical protein
MVEAVTSRYFPMSGTNTEPPTPSPIVVFSCADPMNPVAAHVLSAAMSIAGQLKTLSLKKRAMPAALAGHPKKKRSGFADAADEAIWHR